MRPHGIEFPQHIIGSGRQALIFPRQGMGQGGDAKTCRQIKPVDALHVFNVRPQRLHRCLGAHPGAHGQGVLPLQPLRPAGAVRLAADGAGGDPRACRLAADRLLVEARANIAPADRGARYRQFQEIFVGDIPAIFLNRSVYVYNLPKNVRGVKLNTVYVPSERFADIAKWYVETKRIKK